MHDIFLETDEQTKAQDMAAVEAVRSEVEAAWDAQLVATTATLDSIPDERKGKFLAPVARLPIGESMKPDGLSAWGEHYFREMLQKIRIAKLKPLYPQT